MLIISVSLFMFHLNIYLHKIKKRMNAKLARKTIVINLINQKYSETRTSWHLQRNKKRPSVGFETTLVHQGGLSVGQLQLSLNTDQWAETFFHKSLSSMKHLPTTCHTCTRPELVGYTHSCRRGLCRVLHMKSRWLLRRVINKSRHGRPRVVGYFRI